MGSVCVRARADLSKRLSVKVLRLDGFSATEDHITFLGAVMERASNLQSVVLEEQYCNFVRSALRFAFLLLKTNLNF